MSKRNKKIIECYNKGYRVIDNIVYNSHGKIIKGWINQDGYRLITLKKHGKSIHIGVHRLLAFQKYGNKIFENGIEVRHLDGNPNNNFYENVAIGTHSQNMMDKPKEQRSKNASHKKYPYEKIKKYYKKVKSYKKVMNKFNITSKGTISYIINSP